MPSELSTYTPAQDSQPKYQESDEALISNLISAYAPALGHQRYDDAELELSRTISRRVTNADAISESGRLITDCPPMGNGRPYPPALPDRRPYEVQFDGKTDPDHPYNWTWTKKIYICSILALSALSVSFGSAMFSTAGTEISRIYHVGPTVSALGTTLYVFGFASGPIIWGPLSELYGRRPVLLVSSVLYCCFSFASAVSKDIQSIMITRFFSGFMGAAPLVVCPAAFTDMFDERYRGMSVTVFIFVIFAGPMLAPICGGFTVKNPSLGWRWTCYFPGIIGSAALVLVAFFYPETFAPIILMGKSEKIRRKTGNWGVYAPHEEFRLTIKEICEKNITRPVFMLLTEPILFFVTLYNSLVYGILYMFLTAVPIIFGGLYGWSLGVAELPYLAMLIGVAGGSAISMAFEWSYSKKFQREGYVKPESKLLPMMIGGILFTAGIFWLGWGGAYGRRVHWIVPTIGAVPIGMGLILIFLPCFNYIIDVYLIYAASAIAGNTIMRSSFGAAFPLFSRQLFVNLKVKWAATLVGCLAAILIPVPLFFYYKGESMRARSKFSVDIRVLMKQMAQAAPEAQNEVEEAVDEGVDIKETLKEDVKENKQMLG